MEKVWLKSYPQGVPHDIDPHKFQSIMEVVEQTCEKFADQAAFSNFGVDVSFREVDNLSRNLASFLQNKTNLKPGDRIAIQLPNILQFPIAAFAVQRAGFVTVNTNPLYTEREMLHQFNDAGVKAIIICANFADKLERILSATDIETVIVTEIGDLLGVPKRWLVNAVLRYVKKMVPPFKIEGAISLLSAIQVGAQEEYKRPNLTSEDLAFLQYTGGTTGVAKGAMLTQKNVLANMEQILHWMMPVLSSGREVAITPLPLYHIFSLTVNMLAFFQYGARNVLITNPRDIPGFIGILKKEPFSVMTGVNTLFNALLNHPEFAQLNFSRLRVTVAGGMALQGAVARRYQEVTGTPCVEGYGLTEASPVVCCNPIQGEPQEGSIGLPLPSTDVKICDEKGNELALGDEGELYVQGPQVMRGYWQRADETEKVLTHDGWLRTGDVAKLDEQGYVRIVDRKKDMILVSGFNVYPNEVEAVIAEYPGVVEVGVIGVPDEKSGEAVKAYVVCKDPEVSAEAIIAHCRKELTSYKIPRWVEFRKELPKTNVGKILRRELR